MDRCEALSQHSELESGLTRVYLSAEQHAVNELVIGWMREAGMTTRIDAIGNCIGRYEADRPDKPCLILGSHLDTVRDAGRYDGMLGVVTAIECVHALHAVAERLPFAVEVIGFADEEGVRFGTSLLCSRAIAGTLDEGVLNAVDKDGVDLTEAMRRSGLDPDRVGEAAYSSAQVLAYAELHIEQGPVLETEGIPVGVVTAINGSTRYALEITGMAGHAGTVPMNLRQDALAAAAECVLAVEALAKREAPLVATVGRLETLPGAINVIPSKVRFSLDLRSPDDAQRATAVNAVLSEMKTICERRSVSLDLKQLNDARVALCAPWLQTQISEAIAAEGLPVRCLPSGAGHDGMAMQALTDIGMLFVRCKRGISHNPAEAVSEPDVEVALRVFLRFITSFEARQTI